MPGDVIFRSSHMKPSQFDGLAAGYTISRGDVGIAGRSCGLLREIKIFNIASHGGSDICEVGGDTLVVARQE